MTIVKNVQHHQPLIEQQPTHIQRQQQQYLPNSILNNSSEPSQHMVNQSHIYVNAPNPVNMLQRHHGHTLTPEGNSSHDAGQNNHVVSHLQDHLLYQSPSQSHPGCSGHVPYSPALGPSNNYQNVEVIRQFQYLHQSSHPQNMQQQRPISAISGDRNIQIIGRNKPVGTVAPNTHTTASTVQQRLIGRIREQ